jgi:hypothetical protein
MSVGLVNGRRVIVAEAREAVGSTSSLAQTHRSEGKLVNVRFKDPDLLDAINAHLFWNGRVDVETLAAALRGSKSTESGK